MANPYSSVAISGYNSSPPPDDGSNTAANEIKWATHKNKIGDPLKTAIESINANVSSAFGKIAFNGITTTGVDYAVLTSDQGKLISCTNTITITLPAAATASTPFMVAVKNAGTGTVTVDGTGDETIDGGTTITIAPDGGCILVSNGSGWASALQTSNTFNGNVTVQSDDAGSGAAPTLTLYRNSASPAASDSTGQLLFSGKNSIGDDYSYSAVHGVIDDATDGSEDSHINIVNSVGGSAAARVSVGAGLYTVGVTGGDKGAGTVNAAEIYEAGVRMNAQGVAKAWVRFDGSTQNLYDSFNVSSVTRISAGKYTINFTSALSNGNYVCVVTANFTSGAAWAAASGQTTTTVGVQVVDNQAFADLTSINVVCFGD